MLCWRVSPRTPAYRFMQKSQNDNICGEQFSVEAANRVERRLTEIGLAPGEAVLIAGRACYDWRRAERLASELLLDRICQESGTTAAEFCRQTFGKELSELPGVNLQFLTLKAEQL